MAIHSCQLLAFKLFVLLRLSQVLAVVPASPPPPVGTLESIWHNVCVYVQFHACITSSCLDSLWHGYWRQLSRWFRGRIPVARDQSGNADDGSLRFRQSPLRFPAEPRAQEILQFQRDVVGRGLHGMYTHPASCSVSAHLVYAANQQRFGSHKERANVGTSGIRASHISYNVHTYSPSDILYTVYIPYISILRGRRRRGRGGGEFF